MRITVMTLFLFLIFCTDDPVTSTSGVAAWSTDYKYVLVGINHSTEEDQFIGPSETSTKCDLYLCDSLLNPVDTLFLDRENHEILNLFFDPDDGYAMMKSNNEKDNNEVIEYVYSKGNIQKVFGVFIVQWNKTSSYHGELIWDDTKNFYVLDTLNKL